MQHSGVAQCISGEFTMKTGYSSKKCRDFFREYARVSHSIKKIFSEFSPVMKYVGIDEAFLNVSDIGMNPEHTADDIKKRIQHMTGLTCSIGIALLTR